MNELSYIEQVSEVAQSRDAFADKDSFKLLWNISCTLAKSSMIPANYQSKPEDCMVAVDMANRLGVSPLMVMQNMYVVKGKPAWSGQACMTLISGCGKFKDVYPVYTGEKGKDTRGCYIKATRIKDDTEIDGTEVTIKMAKDEGWYSKKDKFGNETSKWQTMSEQMLAYRAAAFFARVYCPEALMGVQLVDEVIDISKDTPVAVNPFAEVNK